MKTKFNSFLNESDIIFDSVFTTREVDTRVEYIETVVPHEDYLIDTTQNLKSTVIWQLDPDMNNSRIKSMGLLITRVYTSIEWTYDDGEGNTDEGIIEFDKSSTDGEWRIESSVHFEPDGAICPSDVEIDFKTKIITVS